MLAILERIDDLAASSLPDALKAAGQTLVMKVGGASGPLYGTLLMTLGKDLPMAPNRDDLVRAVGAAVDAVKKIGRSDLGQKTMLDVLGPVHEELALGGPGLFDRVRQRGAAAADAATARAPAGGDRGARAAARACRRRRGGFVLHGLSD